MAVYGYAVQIFADFMGYTNIAIGVALLLGFEFPQNFNSPYQAVSLQDFWRRWHMTLSRWLRDYLYISLGGNKKGRVRTYVNLLATMLLGGLWHGAAWTFVIWGGLHGSGLAVERFARDLLGARRRVWRGGAWSRWLGRLVTFHFVCFGVDLLPRLVAARGGLRDRPALQRVGPAVAARHDRRRARDRRRPRGELSPGAGRGRSPSIASRGSRSLAQAASLAVGLMLVDTLGPQGVAPFIYFRF